MLISPTCIIAFELMFICSNCVPDAIENEGALSEEAAHTMKNYAGTCSSNPRELIMDLQSLFSKGDTK